MAEVISTMVQVHVAKSTSDNSWVHLLLRRSDNQRVFPGQWQTVTGRSNLGETAIQAARRELQEETSLEILRFWTLPIVSSFYSSRRDAIVAVPVFASVVSSDAEVTLSHEHQDHRWLSVHDALELLIIPAQKEAMRVFDGLLHQHLADPLFSAVYELDPIG